ncbi:MAG: hypothetical protein V2A56_11080 [bacterium]
MHFSRRWFLVPAVLLLLTGCQSGDRWISPRGDYFGQTPPDSTPVIFAPGIISTSLNERDAAWSPDGTLFVHSIYELGRGTIVVSEIKNGRWTEPEIPEFSREYSTIEPAFASTGSRLWFASQRPLEKDGEAKDYDLWYADRLPDGTWGEPVNPGSPINTEHDEFYPSITESGDILFTASRPEGFGSEDIYLAHSTDSGYDQPANLGPSVNGAGFEFNAMITADGSTVIFSSARRAGEIGGGDMYITHRNENGIWTEAVMLPKPINSEALDYCPSLTPDGKYIFFTSQRFADTGNSTPPSSLAELKKRLRSYGNGRGDIYWVRSEGILGFGK